MARKKRVLMIGWEYPPHHSGGLGVACQGMAHALNDDGMHVCFMLPKTLELKEKKVSMLFVDKPSSTTATDKIIPLHLEVMARELQDPYLTTVSYEKKLLAFIKAGGKVVPRGMLEQVEHYGNLTRAYLKNEYIDIDVIHAHDWLCFPAGIAAKEVTGKPLVVHVHATEFDRGGGTGINDAVYHKEREGMMKADHIIAVSDLTRKTIIEKYGIHPDKVTAVHNGNTTSFPPKSTRFAYLEDLKLNNKKIVLYAGRITIQKGVDYFVRAAKRIYDHNKNAFFVVAGTGDMEQQMKDLVDQLGMRDVFLFTGYYGLGDVPTLFPLAEVIVIPSVSEPFGIIPLEALNYGTPLVLSKQSGAHEVISHALKVDFWDTDKIADFVLSILSNTPLKDTLSNEGRRQVQGLTWEKAAHKIRAVYQSLS